MSEIIRTRGLSHSFKSRQGPVKAVDGVDLTVEAGEIFGFLGPNGAGKTTTLRMLVTLLPPTGGEATVAGCDLRRQPRQVRERIGYVGQSGGTHPAMSGRGELICQGRLYRMSKQEAIQRAAELLRIVELEDAADRPTSTYSGGMRRRLDVALGMVHRPQVLFLDEPTTGLDPQSRSHLWREVGRLRSEGVTVFLTTHYLEEADALCDRLAIIDHGQIVAEGTPEELKQEVAGDVVVLGIKGDHQPALQLLQSQPFVREVNFENEALRLYVDQGESSLPVILRLLDGAHIELRTISLSRPSLDDVFLRQTGHSLREEAA